MANPSVGMDATAGKGKGAMFLTKFLTTLNIRHKLALLVGLVVIGFGCLFFVALEEITEVRKAVTLYSQVLRHAEHGKTLSSLRLTLAEILTLSTQARYVTNMDELRRLERQARELSGRANVQFRDLLQSSQEDVRTSLLSAKLTWDEFRMSSEATFQALLQGRFQVLDPSVRMQRLRQERFTEQLESVANAFALQDEDLTQQSDAAAEHSAWPALFITSSIVLVIIGLTVFISKSVTTPVRQLTEACRGMMTGDFSARVKVNGHDEVGELGATFNHMADELTRLWAEALAELRTAQGGGDPYQIAILDYQMPEMDGERLGQAIKADPTLRQTVLVMLTSVSQHKDVPRLTAAGFAAVLVKPVRTSQLMNTLARVWGAQALNVLPEAAEASTLADPHTITLAAPLAVGQPVRARVLLAEDNIVNQKLAIRMLEKLGCRVDVACDGQEAVEMLAMLPYDLVFMDGEMPELHGYAATREIRRREGTSRHTPIIVMTAHAMAGAREKCLGAGMDDYISKPVHAANLQETQARWLPPMCPESAAFGAAVPAWPMDQDATMM